MRFPEFSGEWENTELQYIAPNICSGKDKPTSNGTVALYGSTGIIGMTRLASYNEEIVLVARVGANAGQLQITTIPCGVTDNTLIINAKEWNRYIYYYLQHYNLNRLVFGSGQPLITGSMLKKLKIIYGEESERNKIVNLLCLLDERIATQNKIIEDLKKLKSAIIEIEYSPKDSYHSHIGGAIVQISKRNKDNHLCNVLSVSNRQGFIKQSEQFEDRNVASDDTSNYKIVEKNDFAYNPARINVGSIARLTKFETGIVSPMYICFRTKDCLLPEYLELFFESRNFFYHIQKRLEGSVRLCLSYEELCNIPIVIPSIEKQKQVDLHLSKLAQKIDLEMKILQFVQQQKTYLLHQMFI